MTSGFCIMIMVLSEIGYLKKKSKFRGNNEDLQFHFEHTEFSVSSKHSSNMAIGTWNSGNSFGLLMQIGCTWHLDDI